MLSDYLITLNLIILLSEFPEEPFPSVYWDVQSTLHCQRDRCKIGWPAEPSSSLQDSLGVYPLACQVLFLWCLHLPLIPFCLRLFNCSTRWECLFIHPAGTCTSLMLFDLFINRKKETLFGVKHILCPVKMLASTVEGTLF